LPNSIWTPLRDSIFMMVRGHETLVPAFLICPSVVSLVDGYNLPMRVDNDKGCPVPSCSVDLGPNCPCPLIPRDYRATSLTFGAGPTPLKGPFGSNGFPVGCKSACAAGLSPDQSNSPNCCTGSYNTAQTCLTSRVDYYSYFSVFSPVHSGRRNA
jgi:hypothetical protein